MSQEHGITVQYTATTCTSSSEPYWLSILFGYKVLIQVTGVVLAFKIRTIQIKDLNDTKETSAIIYITSILLAIVIIVTLTLGDYQNIDGSAYAFGICTSTTLVVAFTFIPKVCAKCQRGPLMLGALHPIHADDWAAQGPKWRQNL